MSTSPKGSNNNVAAVTKVELVDLQECIDDTFMLPEYFQQHANSVENGTVHEELNDGQQLTTATTVVVVSNSSNQGQHDHHHHEDQTNSADDGDGDMNDENEDGIQTTIQFNNGTRILLSPNDRTETEEDRRSHLSDKDDGYAIQSKLSSTKIQLK